MQPIVPITQEILDQLDDEYNQHEFIQVHDMAMQDSGRLVITPENTTQTTELLLDADARHYLAEFFGVPLNYLDKIEEPLLVSRIWNYHIQKRGSDIDVLKAVRRGDQVKTFTTRSFNPLRPSDVVNACRLAMADCVFERSPDIHGKQVDFALTGPDLYEEFANTLGMKSDVHHFSIGVEFNFMGDGSPTMNAYGNRHYCGNRMVSPYGVGGKQFRIYTTEPQALLSKFTEGARKGVEFIRGTMIPKIRATMEMQVPEMANEISDLAKKYGLPERVEALIFEGLRTEDLGGTTYHMINAITRAANSDRCPPTMITKLHQMAGELTVKHDPASPPRRCEQCHQKIRRKASPVTEDTPTTPANDAPPTDSEPHTH